MDTADGFRSKTRLQATAGAAALAAATDLPRGEKAVTTAVEYVEKSKPPRNTADTAH